MASRYQWLLVGCFAVAGPAFAQEKPAAKTETNTIEVRFADDSNVKMTLQTASIDVVTRYGRLTVPTSEIRRIEFGDRTPATLAPGEKPKPPKPDTVVAVDFTILGRVEAQELKARSPYFGEATLKIAELRSIRMLGDSREAKLTLDAGTYGGQQEKWLDTGVDIRAGATLAVTATGTVDLNPADGGTSVVGPDGRASRGAMRGAGGGAFPGGGGPGGGGGGGFGGRGGGGFVNRQVPGALIGRIGENGRTFFIGSRFEGQAPEDGKLYVRIVASSSGSESSGTYDLRVTTGR
jgi:hypothetical protein